ncbi:MAG: phytoene/squalene synthase family protein [Gemmatimonadota bacterium]|nr:MAG: phytoene/squalene synthase family protein [Gemmatimonadota bacterium]
MTHTAIRSAPVSNREFCQDMLPKVSRTFAVCIKLLPHDLEHSVLIAYLLCRIADTLEDSSSLLPLEKSNLLNVFSQCLDSDEPDTEPLRAVFDQPTSDDELLAREAHVVLAEFNRLPRSQQEAVRPWVKEMCTGMAQFAGRTGASKNDVAITTVEDLELYCYYVAGTVGHLLTELFRRHKPLPSAAQYERMDSLATSFGLGLQLTNIIKDVSDDRRRGQSFLPRQVLRDAGIGPEDIENDDHLDESRQVMHWLIDKAKTHLCDALRYSLALPRRHYGIRMFCLTSLYFAVGTLRLADRDPHLLDPNHKVKISRAQVYSTILITKLIAPVNWLVRLYFRLLAGAPWWRRCK